jgi:hypothetical protein
MVILAASSADRAALGKLLHTPRADWANRAMTALTLLATLGVSRSRSPRVDAGQHAARRQPMRTHFIDVVTAATRLDVSLPILQRQITARGLRRYKLPGRRHTHITRADFARLRDDMTALRASCSWSGHAYYINAVPGNAHM